MKPNSKENDTLVVWELREEKLFIEAAKAEYNLRQAMNEFIMTRHRLEDHLRRRSGVLDEENNENKEKKWKS